MHKDRLERLIEIQDAIETMGRRTRRYYGAYRFAIDNNYSERLKMRKEKRHIEATKAIERLKKIFNKELDNIQYKTVVEYEPKFSECCGEEAKGQDEDYMICRCCGEHTEFITEKELEA